MKVQDALELAGRNLREAVLRSTLTTAGIAVGIASLVAMLSLGIGLQNLATRRLERSGLFDTVVVTSTRESPRPFRAGARTEGAKSKPEAPSPDKGAESRVLDENARKEIARLANVTEVYPEIRFAAELSYGGQSHYSTVAGLPASSRESEALEGVQGHFFTTKQAEEAILQAEFARELAGQAEGLEGSRQKTEGNNSKSEVGSPKSDVPSSNSGPRTSDSPLSGVRTSDSGSLIGREIVLRYAEQGAVGAGLVPALVPGGAARADTRSPTRGAPTSDANPWGFSVARREIKLRVVGIVESEPGGALRGPMRARVFIPLELAESLRPLQSLNLLDALRAPSNTSTYQALVVRVHRPAQVRSVEDSIQRQGFRTFSLLDATENLRRFFAVLDLFLGMFGSLALAVASLGIINTLVMAILERRREIGIMKALGASDADVQGLFFAEAGAMGLVGGLAGVTLGWAIGRAINFGTNIYLRRQELPAETIWWVPWWLVVGAIAFAVFVSLLAGLYPASRAAKLDPVQALRYE